MFVRHHKSETIPNVYWNADRVNINSTDLECFLDIKNLRKSDSGKKKLNIIVAYEIKKKINSMLIQELIYFTCKNISL